MPLDRETQIARSCQLLTSQITAGGAPTLLCPQNQRRILLALSTLAVPAACQVVPPGVPFASDAPLTAPFLLPSASDSGGSIIFNIADHGPLVQCAWYAAIDLGTPVWTVYEVIDLQPPCPESVGNAQQPSIEAFTQAPPTGGTEQQSFSPRMFGD